MVQFAWITLSLGTLVGSPCLCFLAYRSWTLSVRQALSPKRSALGLTSITLTFLNWFWLIFVVAIERAKSDFGSYLNMKIAFNFGVWAPISFMLLVIAFFLSFTLKKSARIQAVAAGTLMIAFWVAGLLGGR